MTKSIPDGYCGYDTWSQGAVVAVESSASCFKDFVGMIGTVWLYHGQILQVESFGTNAEGKKTATFYKMGTDRQPTYVWAEFLKEAFRLIRADTIV